MPSRRGRVCQISDDAHTAASGLDSVRYWLQADLIDHSDLRPVLRRNRTSVTHADSGGCCGGSTFGPPVARTVIPAKAGIPRSPCPSRETRLRGNDRKIQYFAAPRSDSGVLRDRLFPIARNRARGGNAGAPAAACARVAGWPKTDAGIEAAIEAAINVVVAHEEMNFRVFRCLRLFSVFRFPEPPIPTVRVYGVVFRVLSPIAPLGAWGCFSCFGLSGLRAQGWALGWALGWAEGRAVERAVRRCWTLGRAAPEDRRISPATGLYSNPPRA